MVVSSLGSFATYRAVTTRGPAERRRSLCSATKPRRDRMASIVERGGNSTSGYVSLKRSSSFLDPHPTVFAPQRSSPRALWLFDEDNIAWRETDRKDRSDLHRGSDLATAVLSAGSPRTARLPHSQWRAFPMRPAPSLREYPQSFSPRAASHLQCEYL